MHELEELKKQLCRELEEYGAKGELTAGSLDVVDKLAHAIKNIDKILEKYDGYSSRGNYNGSYNDGMSYARRRDSMGRYSSADYSRAAEDMTRQLRDLMEQAPNEMTRKELEKLVERMEKM